VTVLVQVVLGTVAGVALVIGFASLVGVWISTPDDDECDTFDDDAQLARLYDWAEDDTLNGERWTS
jgi:hypothetical protein